MSVSHSITIRNAIAAAVCGAVDHGNTYAGGRLVILDANNNVISVMIMSVPAFQAAVNGTALANTINPDNAPVAGGVPAKFQVQDRSGNVIFSGTAGPQGDLGSPGTPLGIVGNVANFAYNAPP